MAVSEKEMIAQGRMRLPAALAFAVPVIAQAIGIISGSEAAAIILAASTAILFRYIGWDAGAIVATAAAGIVVCAMSFQNGSQLPGSAAHAAYWMACAGALSLALQGVTGGLRGLRRAGGMPTLYSSPRTFRKGKGPAKRPSP